MIASLPDAHVGIAAPGGVSGRPSTGAPPGVQPPDAGGGQRVSIAAVMSIPRVGWNDAWGMVNEALSFRRIPLWTHNSVFWAEGLQKLMQIAADRGIDWLLTIDYDSMFTAEHVEQLARTLATRSEIDAVAALQPRRECHSPLFTVDGEHRKVDLQGPTPVKTAHFGLTLIRVAALKRTPKPWLFGLPNQVGNWSDEPTAEHGPDFGVDLRTRFGVAWFHKIDADMWFWKQWELAGNTVYVDPDCSIGHLEVKAVQFEAREGRLIPAVMSPPQWRAKYLPRLAEVTT